MVRQGDFSVELVSADTKQPFKEHAHAGKLYVEVEPDLEYYVSIEKVGTGCAKPSRVEIYVDEQKLDYYLKFDPHHTSDKPKYRGVRQVENGMSYHKALKFNKPRLRKENASNASNLLMGKVEVKIYEAVRDGYHEEHGASYSKQSNLATAELGPQHASLASKKSLRSGEGEATTKPRSVIGKRSKKFKQGPLIDTITLTYCAALGLIEVGVLPRPGRWEHHRMKHPAKGDIAPAAKKARGSGAENDAIVFEDDEEE